MNSNLIIRGDFNVVLDMFEKYGGTRSESQVMIDFRRFVANSRLDDCQTSNGFFTWTNRWKDFTEILERLDRFLISPGWHDFCSIIEAHVLPISISDHFPVKLNLSRGSELPKSSFRFMNMWWHDDRLLRLLEK